MLELKANVWFNKYKTFKHLTLVQTVCCCHINLVGVFFFSCSFALNIVDSNDSTWKKYEDLSYIDLRKGSIFSSNNSHQNFHSVEKIIFATHLFKPRYTRLFIVCFFFVYEIRYHKLWLKHGKWVRVCNSMMLPLFVSQCRHTDIEF